MPLISKIRLERLVRLLNDNKLEILFDKSTSLYGYQSKGVRSLPDFIYESWFDALVEATKPYDTDDDELILVNNPHNLGGVERPVQRWGGLNDH